jgi:hypothetical protein
MEFMDAAVWVSAAALGASLAALLTAAVAVLTSRRDHAKLTEIAIRDRTTDSESERLLAVVFAVERAVHAAHSLAGRDPSQAWFWTPEWQAGEREADADIAAGRTTSYASEEEFFAALDSVPARDEAAAGPRT